MSDKEEEPTTVQKIASMIGMTAGVGIPMIVKLGKVVHQSRDEIAQDVKDICEATAEAIVELVIEDYEKVGQDVRKILAKEES